MVGCRPLPDISLPTYSNARAALGVVHVKAFDDVVAVRQVASVALVLSAGGTHM